MTTRDATHHSFVLRLWRATSKERWQATLVSPTDPMQRQHFASLDALAAYLLAQDQLQSDATEIMRQPQI